jgi:hypothetical protein
MRNNEHVELRTCRTFFALGDWILRLRGLLLCFWIITVNPTFVTRYDLRDKKLGPRYPYLRYSLHAAAFDRLSRVVEQASRQCGACSNFLLTSPGKLRNWSPRCLRAHGLFSDCLRWWVLEIFQNFPSFCWCLIVQVFRIRNRIN